MAVFINDPAGTRWSTYLSQGQEKDVSYFYRHLLGGGSVLHFSTKLHQFRDQ